MCGYAVLKGTHQVDAGLGHNITGHWPRAATPEYRGRRLGNEWGFPGGSEGKKSAWNAGDGFDPWVKKTPWRRERQFHSRILAWRIPWTEKPGWLQSVGPQKVRHE